MLHRIKAKKQKAQRVTELEELVAGNRKNKKGAGRKKSKINEQVYPLLKKEMLKAANIGGDTTKKEQCAKYKKIAKELGYTKKDFPEDVLNGRMQRFDAVLDFSLRACNQKRSNRKDNYELDRLSRYIKDVVKRNVKYASDMVEK